MILFLAQWEPNAYHGSLVPVACENIVRPDQVSVDEMENEQPKSNLEEQIEDNLRKVYKEKVAEVIPDRLLELLKQLKEQESANGAS